MTAITSNMLMWPEHINVATEIVFRAVSSYCSLQVSTNHLNMHQYILICSGKGVLVSLDEMMLRYDNFIKNMNLIYLSLFVCLKILIPILWASLLFCCVHPHCTIWTELLATAVSKRTTTQKIGFSSQMLIKLKL